MFRKILVPVDFTEKNEASVAAALETAKRHDREGSEQPAEVTLLHVIETIDHVEFDEMREFYRGLETRASAKLFALQGRFDHEGVRARHEIVFGKRAESIVRFAEEQGSELIVLGSHKVDPQHPALGWGTISYRIAIMARCPVLLVK
jgi:nucleotide-binding universal stress UspA family protein